MATLRELYKELKVGTVFRSNNGGWCLWEGDKYLYWYHYGSSAETISFDNFRWIVQVIFKCRTANDFLKEYHAE